MIAQIINNPNFPMLFLIFSLSQIMLLIEITNIGAEIAIIIKYNPSNNKAITDVILINNKIIDIIGTIIKVKSPNPIIGKIFLDFNKFVLSKNFGANHINSSQIRITVTKDVPTANK